MAVHAQAQGFDALQDGEGIVRAHDGAEIAQAFAPRAQGERRHRRFLGEDHAVKAVIRFAQFGKTARLVVRGLPVEGAAIDQQAADGRAVPA